MMDFEKFRGKSICVALSGGADSVSLLHYLKARSSTCGFFLSAVNCEHGIRGADSLADTRFCVELCARWQIPLVCFSEDCIALARLERKSLETAAREFRYRCFERLLSEGKCDLIALAHHKDDCAETVLFRLCRGSALTGAAGMKELSGSYVRPFLDKTKEEILSYAKENGLVYCEDQTNFERSATRNILRLDVLPKLNEAVPGASENLFRFALRAGEDDEFLYRLSKPLVVRENPKFIGDSGLFIKPSEEKPLFFRACLLILKELGLIKDYTEAHLSSVFSLQALQVGARVQLPKGIVATKTYEGIRFVFQKEKEEKIWSCPFAVGRFDGGRYEITVSKTEILEGEEGLRVLRFDREKLPLDCVFRTRAEGDRFKKFGGGEKSLKKYFIDEKIPSYLRGELPVLAIGREILLVAGVEISEKIKVTEATKKVLFIGLKRKTGESSVEK